MIMKIYMFLLVAILFSLVLSVAFAYEYSRTEDDSKDEYEIEILSKKFSVLKKILYIGFYIYNIYIFYSKYSEWTSRLTLLCIIVFPILLIAYVLYTIEFKHLLNILKYIFIVPLLIAGIIGFIPYCFIVMITILNGNSIAIEDDEKIYKEYSYSIEIVEMEEIQYTNASGWYVRSTPSIAYYYDVVTENGNQTTKILDGYEYYVEKDEDDKYIDNPHIEVYEIIKEYTNLYGKEKEEHVTYEYTICVPENSIYYEQ